MYNDKVSLLYSAETSGLGLLTLRDRKMTIDDWEPRGCTDRR